MKKILILITVLFLTGCQNTETKESIQCPEQKGDFCIQVYDPVCGEDEKTYSNSCTACQSVKSYTNGECKQSANKEGL